MAYMYDETQGSQSSVEVGSIIYWLLTDYVPKKYKNARDVVMYADNASINKSKFILNAVLWALKNSQEKSLRVVTLRYLIQGHTFFEVDSLHGHYEQRAQQLNYQIFSPNDWVNVVQTALIDSLKRTRVVQPKFNEFINFKDDSTSLSKNFENLDTFQTQADFTRPSVKKSSKTSTPPISAAKIIQFSKANINRIRIRFGFTPDLWPWVDFNRNGIIPLNIKFPPFAYKNPIPLSAEKMVDLLLMVRSGIIGWNLGNFISALPSTLMTATQLKKAFAKRSTSSRNDFEDHEKIDELSSYRA